MRRYVGGLVLALLLAPGVARAGDLTLRDVIELHRSGLGDDLLVAVIEADGGPFTLSFADIQDLKSDGLSERVIAALVRTGARHAGQGVASQVLAVQVEQHVTQVAPAIVVVGVQDDGRDRHDDKRGHADRHRSRDWDRRHHRHPDDVPAASWVTRTEDGRNVTSRGRVDRDNPPAVWVTPRDPLAKAAERKHDDRDASRKRH